MERKVYVPVGVCSKEITFDYNDGCIHNLSFTGGCKGNLQAIGKLLEGKPLQEVVELLDGNTCGQRPTSCVAELCKAIKEI